MLKCVSNENFSEVQKDLKYVDVICGAAFKTNPGYKEVHVDPNVSKVNSRIRFIMYFYQHFTRQRSCKDNIHIKHFFNILEFQSSFSNKKLPLHLQVIIYLKNLKVVDTII